MSEKTSVSTILRSGIIAGTLDAIAGVIVYYIWFGFNAFQVLQYIASGVHGPTAINGSIGMILAGIGYHYFIAFVVAAIYFFAYPKFSVLRDHKAISGLLFGLGIWLVMNLLVLPNSNIPKGAFDLGLAAVGILWHMTLVGLPIALITSNHYNSKV